MISEDHTFLEPLFYSPVFVFHGNEGSFVDFCERFDAASHDQTQQIRSDQHTRSFLPLYHLFMEIFKFNVKLI